MKKIGLDIDEVVADFCNHFFNYLDLDTTPATDWDDERFDLFYKIEKDIDFWMSIPIIYHRDQIKFDPYCFVTSRPIDTKHSKEWLEKAGFKNPIVYTVGLNGSKYKHVKTLDLFVDDAPHNFQELSSKNCNVLLMDRPHNQNIITDKRIFDLCVVQ